MAKSQTSQTIKYSDLEGKIDQLTVGLQPYLCRALKEMPSSNSKVIVDYVLAMQSEINPTIKHRKNLIFNIMHFSRFSKHKLFSEMTKEDVLSYLDYYRKTDEADPLHRWIGSYNIRRAVLVKFFRWLYHPEVDAENREIPPILTGIKQLKRKEISAYKPSDLWTDEDDALFLKYCPHKRIRCYHAMARDTSARPHELLKLKIKDIAFKNVNGVQYAEVVLSGKTTQRVIPLFSSIPYLKDWLDEHPLKNNPDAPVFTSSRKNLGKPLTATSLCSIYTLAYNKGVDDPRRGFYEGYFRRLLKNPEILPEDKVKLEELLKKPWNPYTFRHSALTKKARVLREHVLRQHAGWGMTSRMPQKYLHFFGNESSEDLLVEYGLVKKEKSMTDILKPVQCPNCKEGNKVDSKFCVKCRMVLSFDAYSETKDKEAEKDKKIESQDQKINEIYRALYAQGIIKKESETLE